MFTRILDIMAPSSCLLCAGRAPSSRSICIDCRESLPRHNKACPLCGRSTATNSICPGCRQNPPEFDAALTAYLYRYPVNNLIKGLKYNRRLEIVSVLGPGLCDQIKKKGGQMPACIIPVPLHSRRLFNRGYNQALEIARLLGRDLQIPIYTNYICRTRHTTPQAGLDVKDRTTNVRDAFMLQRFPDFPSAAIVDDIITTGATINEMARLLKSAGVEHIQAWALAHAG